MLYLYGDESNTPGEDKKPLRVNPSAEAEDRLKEGLDSIIIHEN